MPHRALAALLLALFVAGPAGANALERAVSGASDAELLPADEAFILGAERQADGTIVLHWSIAEDYYFYRDRVELALVGAGEASLGEPRFAPATMKLDPFFGRVPVYYREGSVRVPLQGRPAEGAELQVTYQGCNEPVGVCYPPVTKMLALAGIAQQSAAIGADGGGSEQGRIAAALADHDLWWTTLAFVGFGPLLAFTPCVLPMAPILSGVVAGDRGASAGRAVLLVATGVQMGALSAAAAAWPRLWKGLGTVLVLYGALLLVGAAGGGHSVLRPLHGVLGDGGAAVARDFRPVGGAAELRRTLGEARRSGRPAVLDVYAEWCVACQEPEAFTFPDRAVQQALDGAMLLRADVTANDAGDRALVQRFDLYGPPAVLFFGRDGVERRGHRLVGFQGPEAFARRVEQALAGPAS